MDVREMGCESAHWINPLKHKVNTNNIFKIFCLYPKDGRKRVSTRRIEWSMLFRKITSIYCEGRIDMLCRRNSELLHLVAGSIRSFQVA